MRNIYVSLDGLASVAWDYAEKDYLVRIFDWRGSKLVQIETCRTRERYIAIDIFHDLLDKREADQVAKKVYIRESMRREGNGLMHHAEVDC